MLHHLPSSSAAPVKPDLRAYTYEGSDESTRRRSAAHANNGNATPRDHNLPQQPSLAPSSTAARPFSESIFSKCRFDGGRDATYISPIRSPAQPYEVQRQPLQQRRPLSVPVEASGSTPAHSPVPRTPPRYSSTDVAGHADLRHPGVPTETTQFTAAAAASTTTPPTHRLSDRYAPYASPELLAQDHGGKARLWMDGASNNGARVLSTPEADQLSVPSTCWLCEGRCLTGPGSTWAQAPPLFFSTSSARALPVSMLTLCATCAAAMSANPQATAREVLQRCRRTPALRYRTAAYVNALREFKLLLELTADKIVRACQRMRHIDDVSRSMTPALRTSPRAEDSTEPCLDPAVDVANAPLSLFSLPLQRKVLQQLVDALEALLQRDGRAAQLAAAMTHPRKTAAAAAAAAAMRPSAREGDEVPYSEIMAPRERHLLLEEVAHVERQLMTVSAAMKAEAEEAEEAAAAATQRALSRHETRSPARTAHAIGAEAEVRGYTAHVVTSPRPSRGQSGGFSPATVPRSFLDRVSPRHGAQDPLSMLADPRRVQRQHTGVNASERDKAEERQQRKGLQHSAQDNSARHRRAGTRSRDSPQQRTGDGSSSNNSNSRDCSPPVLTSPQRHLQQPPVEPAPFPFSAAPHRCRSRSRSPVFEEGQTTQNSRETAAPATTTTTTTTPRRRQSWQHEQQQYVTRQHAPSAHSAPGRRTMESMVGAAMWATYRHRSPRHNGEDEDTTTGTDAAATHKDSDNNNSSSSSNGGGCSDLRGEADNRKDPENILLNYFAGRADVAPMFRVSPLRHSGQVVSATAVEEGHLADAPPTGGEHDRRRPDNGHLVTTDCSAQWQAQLDAERRRRCEAEEALLAAHTRIAALEQMTNDMAEKLLSHRLSITFRSHLAGMESLVNRWTLLAQNYCLQKSLLFAEEAAALVRAVQRDAYGVAATFPRRPPQSQPALPVQGKSCLPSSKRSVSPVDVDATRVGMSTSEKKVREEAEEAKEGEEEELWVSREEQQECAGARNTSKHDDAGAALVKAPTQGYSDRSSVPRSTSSHTVSPLDHATASAPYAFPSDFRLRPLELHF